MINKIKGIISFSLGIFWLYFVHNYDSIIGKPKYFGVKALIAFLIGIIAVINGIRIYKRKNNAR